MTINLTAWIERNFSGRGRAIREQHETPYPDEPYMSMAEAKELARCAYNLGRKDVSSPNSLTTFIAALAADIRARKLRKETDQ